MGVLGGAAERNHENRENVPVRRSCRGEHGCMRGAVSVLALVRYVISHTCRLFLVADLQNGMYTSCIFITPWNIWNHDVVRSEQVISFCSSLG